MNTDSFEPSAYAGELTFTIPPDVTFADLNLRWHSGGQIVFDWLAVERLCDASSIDANLIRNSGPENVAKLINYWYIIHRLNGGSPDPVKEEADSLFSSSHWGDIQYMYPPAHA